MHKYLTTVLIALILVGCAKEPPKCSDVATVDLVRQIFLEKFLVDATERDQIGKDALEGILSMENMRPSGYDEKIKKFSCEAILIARIDGPDGDSYRVPIKYESQLDDNNNHVVATAKLLAEDFNRVFGYVIRAIKNHQKSAGPANTESAPSQVPVVADANVTVQTPHPEESTVLPQDGELGGKTLEQLGICKDLDLAVTFDMSECVHRKSTAANKKLSENYETVLTRLSPENQAVLKTDQHAWIAKKDNDCADTGKEFQNSMGAIAITDCQVKMTEARIKVLEKY